MELYFLRHAIAAEPHEVQVSHDSERPLTAEGIERFKASAAGLRRLGLTFDRILSSPYVRATQTAQLAAEKLGYQGKIRFSDALIPSAEYRQFANLLKDSQAEEKLLFVGHLPSLGEFVSQLISGGSNAAIDFKKGSICRVDLPEGFAAGVRGELRWLLTPKQLQDLGSKP